MGCCESKKRKKIKPKLNSFSFDYSEGNDLPFSKRTARELYGSLCSENLIEAHHRVFIEFMEQTASAIISSVKKNKNYPGREIENYGEKTIVSYPAPTLLYPVLNEYWLRAVLYTEKYYKLCEKLVGGIIDVPVDTPIKINKFSKMIWKKYDNEVLEFDSYVVRVYKEEFDDMCRYILETIESKLNLNINFNRRDDLIDLDKSKNAILEYIQEIHNHMTIDLGTNELHPLSSNPEVSEFLNRLKNSLPMEYLKATLTFQYLLSPSSAEFYIEEYARFMTMIRFSKDPLTPSEEVDQVWHTHQFFTKNYRKFCYSLYGKLILHGPTKKGSKEGQNFDEMYNRALSLYRELFGEEAPSIVWPPSNIAFSDRYFTGRWVSIYRLIASFLEVYKVKKEHFKSSPKELISYIGNIYCMWIGGNILKDFTKGDRRHLNNAEKEYSKDARFLSSGFYAGMDARSRCAKVAEALEIKD